jgi:hypothetical protein
MNKQAFAVCSFFPLPSLKASISPFFHRLRRHGFLFGRRRTLNLSRKTPDYSGGTAGGCGKEFWNSPPE